MILQEILEFDAMQRSVKRMKLNAKRQSDLAKAAQARLKMQKARQELAIANKAMASEPRL